MPWRDLPCHCVGHDVGRMAGHGAGVTEAKVDIIAIVDISEMRAFGILHKDRKRASPFFHPVHRHAAEQRALGRAIEGRGPSMVDHEAMLFAVA